MGPIWFAIACSSFDISLVFGLIWSSADIEVFYWIKGNVWDQFVRFVRTQICFEEDTSSPFFSRYAITVANNMSARSLDQSHFTIRDERRTILHIDKFIDLVSSMRKILEWITSKRCKILLNLLSLFFSFFFHFVYIIHFQGRTGTPDIRISVAIADICRRLKNSFFPTRARRRLCELENIFFAEFNWSPIAIGQLPTKSGGVWGWPLQLNYRICTHTLTWYSIFIGQTAFIDRSVVYLETRYLCSDRGLETERPRVKDVHVIQAFDRFLTNQFKNVT